jgi:hypothetical protein
MTKNKNGTDGADTLSQSLTPEHSSKEAESIVSRRGRSKSTLAIEAAIIDIVEERHPITVRGVCYALFTQDLIRDMSKNETGRISRVLTGMRERGDVDWLKIVDDSRAVDRVSVWKNPAQIVESAMLSYRRDYWQDQPTLIEIWSEKSTVQGVLAPVLDEYGVTFRVMKGFGSYTSVRKAAEDSLDIPTDRQGVVLYLGDWDPSGLSMSERDLPGRLEGFGSKWSFERIAILEHDTKNLPSFDAATKKADARYSWFVNRYGKKCWELDAMVPNDLRDRVREQIETRLDLVAWEHSRRIEDVERESLMQLPEFFGGRE